MVPAPGLEAMGWLATYQAMRDPDRPALSFGETTISRGDFDRRANLLARALGEEGVGQDDIVILVLPPDESIILFSFALWKLGATPLPLADRLPTPELDAFVALAKPRLVVTDRVVASTARRVSPHALAGRVSSDAPLPPATGRYWKIMPSGGSSGRPKLIVDELPSSLDPTERLDRLGIEPDDILLHPAPCWHNSGLAQVSRALCMGAHVVGMTRFDPLKWLALVERHHVRWAYLVPSMMHRVIKLDRAVRDAHDLSSLRLVAHMAAPCPPWLKDAWIEWLGADRIREIYGATEGFGATAIDGTEWLEHRGSVGKPDPPARIVREDGQPCARGEIGEIFFRPRGGAGSTYHYIGAEPRRRGEWESLGDLGWIDDAGYLYIADRRTDVIICGGMKIYPAEVEGALEAHPSVASCVVVGVPHDILGQRPHAIVELHPGAAPSVAELKTFLFGRLARYKCPRSFEITEQPLRDEAGKVRRSTFRETIGEQAAASHATAAWPSASSPATDAVNPQSAL